MGSTLEDTLKEDIVKTLDKHITLVKGDNCTYSDSKEFLMWACAGANQISLREASEELNDCGYNVPSGNATSLIVTAEAFIPHGSIPWSTIV